ncbi:hypothetical protein BT96DRAFT_917712, partial [Gymnopus androsaceus JB14]
MLNIRLDSTRLGSASSVPGSSQCYNAPHSYTIAQRRYLVLQLSLRFSFALGFDLCVVIVAVRFESSNVVRT